MSKSHAAVLMTGVGKTFQSSDREVEALRLVDLEVAEGEFVSIVGPSGCGKTTLLRLIGGLVDKSSGEILVHGETPQEARKRRLSGWVFQDAVLLPWRSVEQNVRLPSEIYEEELSSDRVAELIELVGLDGFERARPHELSGGMQARVALARALSIEPRILLMDEPFGDLDELTRDRMNMELLRIWNSSMRTIAFVTHSIPEAVSVSDRVHVLTSRPGSIHASMEIDLSRPRNSGLRSEDAYIKLVGCVRSELKTGTRDDHSSGI